MGDKTGGEHDSIFSRIHREILNLINVYFVGEQLKHLRKEIEHHSANKQNIIKLTNSSFAQIASNIVTYSTNVMKVSQQKIPLLIFSAKIESQQLHPCIFKKIKIFKSKIKLFFSRFSHNDAIKFKIFTIGSFDRLFEI